MKLSRSLALSGSYPVQSAVCYPMPCPPAPATARPPARYFLLRPPPMARPTLMWFLFQSTIIFAVVASNIRWHWTPNGYLPAILGAGLAWLLTRLLNVRWRGRNDI